MEALDLHPNVKIAENARRSVRKAFSFESTSRRLLPNSGGDYN